MKQQNINSRMRIISRALTAATLLYCVAIYNLPFLAKAAEGNENPGIIPPNAKYRRNTEVSLMGNGEPNGGLACSPIRSWRATIRIWMAGRS
jgi:hypothetical protein